MQTTTRFEINVHDIEPTKCTNFVPRYFYYNNILNVATCFGARETIIRAK
jgi:hypothetical protein